MTTHLDALVASDYVVCATLRKVSDVFNVELLWERARGDQEGVCLMEALKRHPRTSRTNQRKETRYSQIIIRVPERDYVRDDRLEDSFKRRALVRELRRLHEQELGRYLDEHEVIRYQVEPETGLRPGNVQFLFGRAIYIPADDETPSFRIQAANDGQSEWRELGLIYPGQRLTLLNGDRRASSTAVAAWPFIGGESVLLMLRSGPPVVVDVVAEPPGCLTVSGDGSGRFLVRDRRGRGLRLQISGLAADLESPGLPKPLVDLGVEPSTLLKPVADLKMKSPGLSKPAVDPGRESPALLKPVADQPPPLLSTEKPLTLSESEKPESVAKFALPVNSPDEDFPQTDPWGRRQPIFDISADFDKPLLSLAPTQTAFSAPEPAVEEEASVSDRVSKSPALPSTAPLAALGEDPPTWIPRRRSPTCLQVIGVALQRLSTYATAGISDWRLSFNRAGGLVLDNHPDAAAWLRIDSTDRIFGEVADLSAPLNLPSTWQPFPELALELYVVPPPMAAHYLGWLRLPKPLTLPVPRERAVSFGRGSEADIAPKLLADPRSLRWDGNPAKSVGISAEYLGLSRRHLRLQVRRDDWWAQLESQNMPVYRLTPSGDLLDVLTPGVNTATEVKPGELLVAGGYVLRLGAVE